MNAHTRTIIFRPTHSKTHKAKLFGTYKHYKTPKRSICKQRVWLADATHSSRHGGFPRNRPWTFLDQHGLFRND